MTGPEGAPALPAGAAPAPSATRPDATFAAWLALAIFTVVTLFAFVDRTIFGLLAEPIRKSLNLSDVQLGLFQGTGLALFAALANYPIGWAADRFDRRFVMIGGIVVWSTAVVGCGLAKGFGALFLCSAVVGAGEAAMAPVFYSMIPDLFRGDKRQLANSIFGVAASSVGGLALAISGQLPALAERLRPALPAALHDTEAWRLSFFLAAAPAPVMIALIATVRLGGPRRAAARAVAAAGAAAAPVARLIPYLRSQARTLAPFVGGVAVSTFGGAAISSWTAVILMRLFGQTPAQVGGVLGPLILTATAGGFLLSVGVTRAFHGRLGPILPVRVLWLAYAAAAVTDLALMVAPNVTVLYAIALLQMTLTLAANLLSPTAIQNLAPTPVRGRFVAVFFLTLALSGAFAGPLVGLLSDAMAGWPRGILVAATGIGAASLTVAALLMRLAERNYAATVEANARADAAHPG